MNTNESRAEQEARLIESKYLVARNLNYALVDLKLRSGKGVSVVMSREQSNQVFWATDDTIPAGISADDVTAIRRVAMRLANS